MFELDHRLFLAFGDTTPPFPAPERSADEPEEARRRRGWRGLFGARWDEVERYRDYLEGRSNVATHQVVKGSEFEQVMVVMDDEAATGHLFSYDKVFGAASLTKADLENVTKGNETSIDRTLRLLYVTCSRAKDNLALVLWSRDPEAAIRSISAGGWFSPAEVARMPEC